MPILLRDRLRPDSITEFRAAAPERFRDGTAAAESGRRTAAIYLWGYAAEMTVKAAYFSLKNFLPAQAISIKDLEKARTHAIQMHQIAWSNPGNYHNVAAWAELVITTRSLSPVTAYGDPTFGLAVQQHGRAIRDLWSEQLRYHKNVAYQHEVARMHAAVGWLLDHSLEL